jgi:hypothetical protein
MDTLGCFQPGGGNPATGSGKIPNEIKPSVSFFGPLARVENTLCPPHIPVAAVDGFLFMPGLRRALNACVCSRRCYH